MTLATLKPAYANEELLFAILHTGSTVTKVTRPDRDIINSDQLARYAVMEVIDADEEAGYAVMEIIDADEEAGYAVKEVINTGPENYYMVNKIINRGGEILCLAKSIGK